MRETKAPVRALALTLVLALLSAAPALALDADTLVPGGNAVGIELETEGVLIAAVTEVATEAGNRTPAADAGLRAGDLIEQLNGREINCAADFLTVMSGSEGGALELLVKRGEKEIRFEASPVLNREGNYQLGLWLRDGVSGIGTVTFYDPASGIYGALGHGINDLETGQLMGFDSGSITGAEVVNVIRGASGSPGELCGQFDPSSVLGSLEKNTERGVFGAAAAGLTDGTAVPVAREDEVALGPAVIRSNVSGNEIREYAVEITRIYHDPQDNRSLLLTVTDEALLERTGGIVQGM